MTTIRNAGLRRAKGGVRPEGKTEVSGLVRLASDYRGRVIGISLILGAVATVGIAVIDPASRALGAASGIFVGVSALALALVIYWLSAQDSQRLLAKVADLEESLGSITEVAPPAKTSSIDKELEANRHYVDALQHEVDIPDEDIRAVYDPGTGKGNRPRIIQTKKGYRYSVFRGGRGKSGYTVSQIGSPNAKG